MKTKNYVEYCPKLNVKNKIKRQQKSTKRRVLKMLAVMENQQPAQPGPSCKRDDTNATTPSENGHHVQEFLATGRTGRRNALPDILAQPPTIVPADLPTRLEALSTTEAVVPEKKTDDNSQCKRRS